MSEQAGLRRSLNVWSAIGISVALMAPAMAVNLNPQATASVAGRAVPTAFLLATGGALLVAYSFVRLAQRFEHSGSVYGFVGATLGPRAGSLSGVLLALAYLAFSVVTVVGAGRFIEDELHQFWSGSPASLAFLYGLVALAVSLVVASRSLDKGGRLILAVEAITVVLILVVCGVVLVRLIMHHAPGGRRVDFSVFAPTPGTSVSNVFLGVVFGFLSFAGFEGAAALGEETVNPRRDVPRAVAGTVIFGGIFFVVVTAIEMMGFGADRDGIARFVASESLVGDLARSYLTGAVGHVITIGAAISAASCASASLTAASRLVFAIARDSRPGSRLARVSPSEQVPAYAAGVVAAGVLAVVVLGWVVSRGEPFQVFLQAGTAGTLILLIAYLLATAGCMRLLFVGAGRRVHGVPMWQAVVPLAGLVVLGYTVWRNLVPPPVGAAWWGVGAFLAAVAVAGVYALTAPRPLLRESVRVEA